MRNRKIKFTTIAAIAFSVISSLLLLRCSLPPVANIILPSLQLQCGYGFSDKHLYLGCERLNDDIRTREKTTTGHGFFFISTFVPCTQLCSTSLIGHLKVFDYHFLWIDRESSQDLRKK
ncbi:hypothetical protein AAZX31_02G027800 [Glycine max]|uniref:Uncharacterized protein n=1 Tax=Glycine max TaxID=3847 RepID=K7K648_SOYBN|nr:hypothetical protein JHK87_002863 [Glycine soja]KAG5062007.1 hypothetical protein JHK85_003190 [Glycine max]KAG5078973.1 hypothetical protein JHK86_003038 [Glycine max]KAH1260035.1 hypothetical protein GmHk_02G003261 [Glycine max]KRH69468.1 hypothetical protein GLYMA_02G029500v4 [Glycine max]